MMKQHYFIRFLGLFGIFAFGLTSCAEKEDMVYPKETCATMATVQYQAGSGLSLVLEDGQVLQPENVKQLADGKKIFAIDGFAVKAGQQILIGYKPAVPDPTQKLLNRTTVKVNCIVGLGAQ